MAAYIGPPDAVDYSFSRANVQQLVAAGIDLVSRYLSHTPGKNLTVDEARVLLAAGVGILFNWESSAGRAKLGYAAGALDARDAVALVKSILTALRYSIVPLLWAIYFSADFDVTDAERPAVRDYFRGVRDGLAGLFRAGVYGEASVVDDLHSRGLTDVEWQTYAWSGGVLSPQADLYQFKNGQVLAGASVDFDKIIHPSELGALWPAGHVPQGGGTPLGDDMFSDADRDLLNRIGQLVHTNTDSLASQIDAAAGKAATLVSQDLAGTKNRVKAIADAGVASPADVTASVKA